LDLLGRGETFEEKKRKIHFQIANKKRRWVLFRGQVHSSQKGRTNLLALPLLRKKFLIQTYEKGKRRGLEAFEGNP